MTEAEWSAATDPRPLIGHLRHRISDRKGRLFAVACCRIIESKITDNRVVSALQTAELVAEGAATDDVRAAARSVVSELNRQSAPPIDASRWACLAVESVLVGRNPNGLWHKIWVFPSRAVVHCDPTSLSRQTAIFRCIFGNPFRPVAFDACWRTADVLGLARGIYEDRAFDRMPMLADALMDAGCDSDDILSHCRGDGPHVRGCWVVDLILGKE